MIQKSTQKDRKFIAFHIGIENSYFLNWNFDDEEEEKYANQLFKSQFQYM